MLNQIALAYLSALTYRADAERRINLFPAAGIYWIDEIPDMPELMKLPEDGLIQILRLFSIRYRIWEDEPLTEDDHRFWNDAQSQLHDCPIFRRIMLSAEDLMTNRAAARCGSETTAALLANAKQMSVIEKCPGVEEISATFDLGKHTEPTSPSSEISKPLWARILGGKNR